LYSLIPLAIGFAFTFTLTPPLAEFLKARGIVGVDIHKENKPEVPEMVGISILVGFLLAAVSAYLIRKELDIMAIIVVTCLVGLLGVIDGLWRLTAFQKIVSLTVIGAILIPFLTIRTDFNFAIYLLVPILFMCASNFTNMLAGFNGMEIGTGAIAAGGLTVVSLVQGREFGFLVSSALFGSLIAFLYFNKFPARVFPGDVGTLIIGAIIFSTAVLDSLELAGAIIFLPYIVDAGLKYSSAGVMTRESQSPTRIEDGLLYVPSGSNLSLPRLFIKRRPMSEKEVVRRVWAVEIIACMLAISVAISI
jgi:UDP-N-acetylglucosamine--dolichyl-phosphate N-acetylglucosaminephosphotransferase